jgi:dihydroorotate dehydrogenase (NAD+) catalytic subunit
VLHAPFYDPTKSYEENYSEGPFGAFRESGKQIKQTTPPAYNYLGHEINFPFGIPAGPLLNSAFVKAAFEKGFDIAVYKTVRSNAYPCHPHPNVLSVRVEGDLTPEKMAKPLVTDTNYHEPLSITNSFGVPSKTADVWQADAQKAVSYAGPGQVMVLSFMGTVWENQTQQEFIDDYVLAARLAAETDAKVLEVNLSCPNIGNEGLVCYNLEVTKRVAEGIRNVIGNKPLILKVGYYANDKDLLPLAEIANEYANGIAAINTLQATVVNEQGEPALPGKNRLRSGVCGATIKWAGLETVRKLKNIRDEHSYSFHIEGLGGVTVPEDYDEYRAAGADTVMSATGAMWNPFLAQEIKARA